MLAANGTPSNAFAQVYSFQGQFAFNPAYQGIPNSAYRFQTLGNAISFITGLIAAVLYGNIGIKVMYAAVLRDLFKAPPLDDKKGKWLWVACGKFGMVSSRGFLALIVDCSARILGLRLGSCGCDPSSLVPRIFRWRRLHSAVYVHLPTAVDGRL